jgi:hypothetical protein
VRFVNEKRRTDKFDVALQNEVTGTARRQVCSYRTQLIVPAQVVARTPKSTGTKAWKATAVITLVAGTGSVKQNWGAFVRGGRALPGMESFSEDYQTRTERGLPCCVGANEPGAERKRHFKFEIHGFENACRKRAAGRQKGWKFIPACLAEFGRSLLRQAKQT